LSLSPWKHISEIHVLLPSHVGHIYVAQRANLPHYQEVFFKFVLGALEAYEDSMPVYLYMRGEDYSNDFMLVRNSEAAVKPFLERIDWMEIHRASCHPKNKLEKSSLIEKERQDNFGDTGLCFAVRLEGTSDGIAEPRLKPETRQNSVVLKGYTVLTESVTSTPVKWMAENQRLYYNADNPGRQERFASRIQEDNVFENMRNTSTNLQSKCGCHRDCNNSYHNAFRAVVGISVLRNVDGLNVRIGINAQARKLIDDCLSRSKRYRPMLERVLSECERMSESRKLVSKSLLHGRDGGGMLGFRCPKNPCNMDQMSYHEPFINYLMLLVKHFGLTFPETVGLMSVIEVLPNTAYFFCAAAEALLAMRSSDLYRCHRGFAFGYLVAKLLLHLQQTKPKSCPGTRFNIYWEPELTSGKDWEDPCTLKTLACVSFSCRICLVGLQKEESDSIQETEKAFLQHNG
jgi:hypothetical protein